MSGVGVCVRATVYRIVRLSLRCQRRYTFQMASLTSQIPASSRPKRREVKKKYFVNSLRILKCFVFKWDFSCRIELGLRDTEHLRCVSLPGIFALSEQRIRKCYGIQLFCWLFTIIERAGCGRRFGNRNKTDERAGTISRNA